MKNLLKKIGGFRRDEDGATLVEYGIAITLAVVVGTTALIGLAGNIEDNMDCAGTVMANRTTTAPTC